MLAAGAAAYALLKQKKTVPPTAEPEPLPAPAPQQEIPTQSQIEQWLSRQITREEQAPVFDFSAVEPAPQEPVQEPEDDYHPQSLLLDDAEEAALFPPASDEFAGLTEPVPQQEQTPSAPPEPEPAAPAEPEFSPEFSPPPPQVPETPPVFAPAAADAAWTLGVEPLPSLNETAPAPFTSLASSMFFTAPLQQEELAPPPVFSLPVFQGAAFPDEISVAPPFEPVAPEPVVHLTPTPAMEPEAGPANEPPPVEETSPEIAVQLAEPGEASFDPPLAAATQNPWEPEPETPAIKHAAPPPSHLTSTVVEAEIILRPRAPMQNSVTAKSKFSPPDFIKKDFAESFDVAPVASTDAPPSDEPEIPAREPRSRPSWRSWWRGD